MGPSPEPSHSVGRYELDQLIRSDLPVIRVKGVEILLISVGQRVQVLLRGLDLRMSHPIHHALEIRATSEKPRRVRVPKIMYPNAEVDARCFDSR